jgi:hypothetical protein
MKIFSFISGEGKMRELIVEKIGVYEQISQGENLGNNVVGCLNSKMKDIHIISSTIHQKSSVILHEEERRDRPETEIGCM